MARLLICACLCLLVACAPAGQEQALEEYVDRLANTLALDPREPEPGIAPLPPRVGEIQLDTAGSKVDALDFLALSGCALQTTIGKRNSSLGRLARPSQRLLLKREYLRLAPACVENLQAKGEAALAADLQTAWELKRSQVPTLVFNATLGSEEYRAFWRQRSQAPTSSAVITALEAVNGLAKQWLAGNYEADNQGFEILLSEIRRGDGGSLQADLIQQAAWLGEANRLLETQRAEGPLCRGGLRPARVEVLENVIRRFFVEGVQPGSAELGRRHFELLPPLQALEQQLANTLPAPYRDWAAQRDQQLEAAVDAPMDHVAQLKRTLAPCEAGA